MTTYDLDNFVNTNAPVIEYSNEEIDAYEKEHGTTSLATQMSFAEQFEEEVIFTKVNKQADPVYVYEDQNGNPIAWYDLENYTGYIFPTAIRNYPL